MNRCFTRTASLFWVIVPAVENICQTSFRDLHQKRFQRFTLKCFERKITEELSAIMHSIVKSRGLSHHAAYLTLKGPGSVRLKERNLAILEE